MYNEDLKLQFIEKFSKSESYTAVCTALFNSCEKFEISHGDDLCTMDEQEMQRLINGVSGMRAKSALANLSIIRLYSTWCINQKVPNAKNSAACIKHSDGDKIRERMVPNPMYLQIYLDDMYDPESEETIDNMYRCYHWLAFMGVKEEDILSIKCSDVDFENMVVRYGDEELPIYREAMKSIKNCAKLMCFKYKHPNYQGGWIYRNRYDGDMLIRGIRAKPSLQTLHVEISRKAKAKFEDGKISARLSFYRLWLSGLFYRTYESECRGIKVDFMSAAVGYTDGRVYKLDKSFATVKSITSKISRDYMEDYKRWKEAFNL